MIAPLYHMPSLSSQEFVCTEMTEAGIEKLDWRQLLCQDSDSLLNLCGFTDQIKCFLTVSPQ